MRSSRASGILLHPTSLPGRFGIGDLGDEAYRFVDHLVAAGQTYWQILPLAPTGIGNSPYSAFSAFAGNPLLISPEKLAADSLISPQTIENVPQFDAARVDYGGVYGWKTSMLAEAFETYKAASDSPLKEGFDYFARENAWWLDDYALFRSLKVTNDGRSWNEWAGPLKRREPDALNTIRSQLARDIQAVKFSQYLFFRQWLELRRYANEKGVRIIGDIPIFVAYDSADVWCNQDKFKIDDDLLPLVSAGVPPDFFSATGQLWGNPIYDWAAMQADDFGWWTARVSFALHLTDIVRLDHFIGFIRNWEVPGGDDTAVNGEWADVPGQALFETLKRRLGDLPVIAEDLGSMTPEVEKLRDDLEIPGIRILHNAFGGDAFSRDLPHNYIRNCVAYTGNHDNDTSAGWYKRPPKNVRDHIRRYLKTSGREMHWEMVRAVFASVADMVIVPAQDILGLGSEARMNTPATGDGNWEWRLTDQMNDETLNRLREITELYGRTRD